MSGTAPVRMPAAARRAVILEAAGAEFARNGLAGGRLEVIAEQAGVSHPRIVQLFGSKKKLFLEVVDVTFDKIEAVFERAEPTLTALGDAYVKLLRREPGAGLVMLQGFAAAADPEVQVAVRRRHLDLMKAIARLTGADALQVRTFFATGLIQTVSTALELSERRADTAWSAWILQLVAPAGQED
ncbi:TetR/AcrR family transcriptional regulator [Lentzea aerocolonigenes]|uniref:TetR/AcrR family transcriptional regulator n=1 Tax=Lentzea aerocolonigenes TaxID=68170 RepID=UPI0009DF3AF3|nr:TetR family transcriptional regulator [Lentzea aerocolonigenes]MCP2241951.1 transcriptional regulator, TetR family [Lentzea aerocolonigenes]